MTKARIQAEIREPPVAERVVLLEELWRDWGEDHPQLLDWQKEIVAERLAYA